MQFSTLFFCLLLSCLCLSLAQGTSEDCCLKYVSHLGRSIRKHAVKYRNQYADGGCNINAVIFTMRKGRRFCADPKADWVKQLQEILDRRHQKTEKMG
ncbi:C-C motif chemokine 20 [Mugil cephalus]|uniref:C-C motif chemokine 20 n=1 Tax=Mugil cephalus TaxID=48193 RepID=UPI001FB70FA9|nr:C-C motif chemokine 20 [Mugil cephalus]